MSAAIRTRPVVEEDEADWRAMWAAYNAFYRVEIPEAVTTATWRRILAPEAPLGAILALLDDSAVGFANFVIHPYTWSTEGSCLMEDLFVREEARGRGAGRLLIDHLIELGRKEGWTKLYWITHESNETARRLYDRFCRADGFIQYTIPLSVEM